MPLVNNYNSTFKKQIDLFFRDEMKMKYSDKHKQVLVFFFFLGVKAKHESSKRDLFFEISFKRDLVVSVLVGTSEARGYLVDGGVELTNLLA